MAAPSLPPLLISPISAYLLLLNGMSSQVAFAALKALKLKCLRQADSGARFSRPGHQLIIQHTNQNNTKAGPIDAPF